MQPELVVQTGHIAPVWAMAASSDGRWLASASVDQTVAIWDVHSGRELRTLVGHTDSVSAVAFSPDGQILASGSYDHTVRLWNVNTGRILKTISPGDDPVFSVAFGPDAHWLAASTWNQIHVWDLATGAEIRPFTRGPYAINAISFSPDGKVFAATDKRKKIALYDVMTGRKLFDLRWSRRVSDVCFSRDGRLLATTGKEIVLWEAATGRQLATIEGRTNFGSRTIFSSDGQNLVFSAADYSIVVWNIATGQQRSTLNTSSVDTVALVGDPAGKWVAVAAQNSESISVVDFQDGQLLRLLDTQIQLLPLSVTFTADGRQLLDGTGAGALISWNFSSGRPGPTIAAHDKSVSAISVSPDGTLLASASWDQTIRLWNLANGQPGKVLTGHTANIYTVAFSPNGRMLASGSLDLTVRLWDVSTGQELRRIDLGKLGPFLIPGSNDEISAVAFSPNGKILACSDQRATIKLFEVATGEELRTLEGHTQDVESLAFSPDGHMLASGSYDRSIRLWDIPSGRLLRSITAHTNAVTTLAFTRDGRRLISGSRDNEIKIWDTNSGANLRILSGHAGAIWSISLSRDERWLASQSLDGTTRLWDFSAGELKATLIRLNRRTDWLVVTPDGLFDGSPGGWQQILWRFNNNTADVAPVESFFRDFYYPGLLSDIVAGKNPHASRGLAILDRRLPGVEISLTGATSHPGSITTRNIALRIHLQDEPADRDHASSSGIRDLRLFRNGSLVRRWHGDLLHDSDQTWLEAEIPILAGENRLTAYAFNHDNVKSEDAILSVTGASSLNRKGTAYVLNVGINHYDAAGWDLRYAESDAREFADELQKDLRRLGTFRDVRTISLYNGAATKANLLAALGALAGHGPSTVETSGNLAPTQPEDAVFIYYAGHGTAAGPDFYLIPHDLGFHGNPDQLDDQAVSVILQHSISNRDLEDTFETMDANQVILIIDACRSGQALHADDPRQGPMNSGGLAQLAYDKGMSILTASEGYQAALELSSFQHGLLTYALINQGLQAGMADQDPKDGTITLRKWLDFATLEVPKLQMDAMWDANRRGFPIAVVEGEQRIDNPKNRSLQQPRVFYRREPEAQPFVVMKLVSSSGLDQ
jgi:WD40 repeat protein